MNNTEIKSEIKARWADDGKTNILVHDGESIIGQLWAVTDGGTEPTDWQVRNGDKIAWLHPVGWATHPTLAIAQQAIDLANKAATSPAMDPAPRPSEPVSAPAPVRIKREKPKSRTTRWAEAAANAAFALQELLDIQEEYQNWLDNLPESLQSGAVADKLQTIVDLDIQSAKDTADEAENADLPLGFGRD